MKLLPPQRKSPTGFTLVEMLVSVTVLVLIMTFIAQMMNSASISTTLSGKHMDTDAEARLVFDRMAMDFARMSRRTDLDFLFIKQPVPVLPGGGTTAVTGTDQMFFYSEAPAYPAASTSGSNYNSTVALIGYTINTTGSASVPAYSLQRLSKGLSLNAAADANVGSNSSESQGVIFLTSPVPGTTAPASPGCTPFPATWLAQTEAGVIGSLTDNQPPSDMTDYDLLSPEVFRISYCFQVEDLSKANAPSAVYSNFPVARMDGVYNHDWYKTPNQIGTSGTIGDRWYDTQNNRAYLCTGNVGVQPTWTPNGLADVRAVVVSIAILDTTSRRQLHETSQLDYLAGLFLDPTEDQLDPAAQGSSAQPILMADLWQKNLDAELTTQRGSSDGTVPTPILGQVRIYQRFFYLNNN